MLQLERIQQAEQTFDQASQLTSQLAAALEQAASLPQLLAELIRYYEGDWRSDYESDERGELPAGLKRGVLSQDGLYNLLTDQADLAADLRTLADCLDHEEVS